MPGLPHPLPHPLSRRALLGLGSLGLLSAGCSVSTHAAGSPQHPASSAPGSAEARPGRALSPDVRTAARALAAVMGVQTAVDVTLRRLPATRPQLGGLASLHEAHRRVLVDAVPTGAMGPVTIHSSDLPHDRAGALRRIGVLETRLHTTLQSLALVAQSGDFARLLASMAAGVSVHRTALAG